MDNSENMLSLEQHRIIIMDTRFKKNQIPWNKGKKFPEFSGENHGMWKGGQRNLCECGNEKAKKAGTCKECLTKRSKILMKGNKNGLGMKRGEEVRKRLSNQKIGSKNPQWKGGVNKIRLSVYKLFESRIWRQNIMKRDNYTCQFPSCKHNTNYLDVHHIIKFSDILENMKIKDSEEAKKCELLWDMMNGITLCKDCHKSIFSREDEFEDLFRSIVITNSKNIYV